MSSIIITTFACLLAASPFVIINVLLLLKPEVTRRPVIDLIKFSALKPLRYPVMFEGENSMTNTESFHTIFSLGEGACGKNVKTLVVTTTQTEMCITQYHTDGTKKDFIYKKTDIIGRVEIQYEGATK